MRAVVLAGGKGTRLLPYSAVLPKPLVPIGDMPVLEVLLRRLRAHRIVKVTLAVSHLASLLMAYFGTGERFGVEIDYVMEDTPLGTAGPLGNVTGLDASFLVLNGDLLTDLDFGAMVQAHRRSQALATIGLYDRTHQVDFGVIETSADLRITDYVEKPLHRYRVSMGAYVFEPGIVELIPRGRRFDLPDLIRNLLNAGETVNGYLHDGYWLDIGRPDDYSRAQEDFPSMRARLLGETDAEGAGA